MGLEEGMKSQGLTVWPHPVVIHTGIDPSVIPSVGLLSKPAGAGCWMRSLLPGDALYPLDSAESPPARRILPDAASDLELSNLKVVSGINFYAI